jgi:hypothetical protein
VNLDQEYDRLCQGDWNTLETCWRERIGLIGKDVIVECADSSYEGRLVDVTFQRLELDQREVGTTLLLPEMVKHLTGR